MSAASACQAIAQLCFVQEGAFAGLDVELDGVGDGRIECRVRTYAAAERHRLVDLAIERVERRVNALLERESSCERARIDVNARIKCNIERDCRPAAAVVERHRVLARNNLRPVHNVFFTASRNWRIEAGNLGSVGVAQIPLEAIGAGGDARRREIRFALPRGRRKERRCRRRLRFGFEVQREGSHDVARRIAKGERHRRASVVGRGNVEEHRCAERRVLTRCAVGERRRAVRMSQPGRLRRKGLWREIRLRKARFRN